MNPYLVFALGMVVATTKPSDPPKYAWDLSKSQSIEQVAWPRNLRAELDLYYDVTANGVVRVVLPGGRVFEHSVEGVSFCRLGDGKRITSIRLVFEEQTIEEVYATATALAKTWGIPTAKLIAWKRVVKDESSDGVLISRPDVDPSVFIEILKTYDPKKPFFIHFGIAWDITPFLPKPATKPAAKPATQPSTRPAA
jgi:hypothetical protein